MEPKYEEMARQKAIDESSDTLKFASDPEFISKSGPVTPACKFADASTNRPNYPETIGTLIRSRATHTPARKI